MFLYNPGTERQRLVEIQGPDGLRQDPAVAPRRDDRRSSTTDPTSTGRPGCRAAPNASLVRALPVQPQPRRADVVHPDHRHRLALLQRDAEHLRRLAHLLRRRPNRGAGGCRPVGRGRQARVPDRHQPVGPVHLPGGDLSTRLDGPEHAPRRRGDGARQLDLLRLLRRRADGCLPRRLARPRLPQRAAERQGPGRVRAAQDLRRRGHQGGDLRAVGRSTRTARRSPRR